MQELNFFTKEQLHGFAKARKGETKLGEKINLYEPSNVRKLEEQKKKGARFAILGIPESIGALGNFGRSGSETAFNAFLNGFLNIQSNRFLSGKEFVLFGEIKTEKLQEKASQLKDGSDFYHQKLHVLCDELDELVSRVIQHITALGLTPIVIGGGQNNTFPILKGVSAAHKLKKGLNCINMDAQADFRSLEGRHSGNGFSYAKQHGYLNKYAVFGLHENYNPEYMLKTMGADETIHYQFLEQITYLDKRLIESIGFVYHDVIPSGVELDLKAVRMMPASITSPSGFSLEQARHYVRKCAEGLNVAYLHLSEAAPQNPFEEEVVGKALAYLVTDFVKASLEKGI